MKKNKMMRLASVLMVLTLLTTSVIGGTFAKYVTTAESTDSARVAKWGIKMDVDGNDMFTETYSTGSDSNITVENKTGDGMALVAPGTTSKSIYTVTGTPETDYEISFTGTASTADVFLGAGLDYGYTDADDSNGTMIYDASMATGTTALYYPIVYTVSVGCAKNTGTLKTPGTTITELGKVYAFDTLKEALDDLAKVVVSYDSNEECGLTVTIAWEWAFDDTAASRTLSWDNAATVTASEDVYDTILGDLAAGTSDLTLVNGSNPAAPGMDKDYNLTIEYTITMTATQVD